MHVMNVIHEAWWTEIIVWTVCTFPPCSSERRLLTAITCDKSVLHTYGSIERAFLNSYFLGMRHMCAFYTVLLLSYSIIKYHINCENNIINLSYTSPINHKIKGQIIWGKAKKEKMLQKKNLQIYMGKKYIIRKMRILVDPWIFYLLL